MRRRTHQDRIREEFSKQAAIFAEAPEMRDEEALRALLELTGAGTRDTSLDVARRPGIVACAFAEVVAEARGVDLTPAMLERAQSLQEEKGLANVSWLLGDVHRLPSRDRSFSIVTSRYAFHQLEEPRALLTAASHVTVLPQAGSP